ncbi:MAG: hypothetical protein HC877_13220 [Thioploca sp.]|nr:hypothetical protein [Thioploca sp.]
MENRRFRNYLCGLIYGDSFKEFNLGWVWYWNAIRTARKAKYDCAMILVEVHNSLGKILNSKKWFYIPQWVKGEVDIPISPLVWQDRSLKSDLRRIKKNALQYQVCRDPESLNDFYYNMHIPYITTSHGNCAYISSFENMECGLTHGDLLFVTKHGERIAGALILYEKTGVRLWSFGVRDGNKKYLVDGVIGALYYYSLVYLENKGFNKVNFGWSRSFLRDGVLRYKAKWSQWLFGTSQNGIALRILSDTQPVREFLCKNPFIFKHRDLLYGAYFVDSSHFLSPEEFKKIDDDYSLFGLSKLFVYQMRSGTSANRVKVPPEQATRIELKEIVWKN